MKKQGFTLMELIAVIVILAILALIAIPTISNVVKKSKMGAAEVSAYNYIDAVEKYVILHDLDSTKYPYDLKNNTFNVSSNTEVSLLDIIIPKAKAEGTVPGLNSFITVKGDKPKSGAVTLNEKGKVTEAELLFGKFYVECTQNKCQVLDSNVESTLTISKTDVSLTYPAEETLEVLENTSNGELSCTSSDSSIATCEINENNLVVKSGVKEGNATITLTSKGNSKYRTTSTNIIASVENGTLSVNASGYNGTYDGKAHGITVTASDATIKYGTTNGTYDLTENPTYTNVGTYTVYYEVIKEGYKTVTGSEKVIINDIPTYKINWTESIAGVTEKYIGEGTIASSDSSKPFYKRIVYTGSDGQTHYANPYVATTIYIKQGTKLQFQKYANANESYIRIDSTPGYVIVQNSVKNSTLLTVPITPSSNLTLTGKIDERSNAAANYWYIYTNN